MLIARHLHTITTRYVTSSDFINKHSVTRPEDLQQVPLIYGSVSQWRLEKGSEHISVQASRGFKIANGQVMYRAALAGQGVARLADIYVEGAIKLGLLQDVLPGWGGGGKRRYSWFVRRAAISYRGCGC